MKNKRKSLFGFPWSKAGGSFMILGSLFCFFMMPALLSAQRSVAGQQEKTITGHVVDENGASLAGVLVQVEGTSLKTVTNEDGQFSLSIPLTARNVSFSYMGYLTQVVPIGSTTQFSIRLLPDTKALDEIVVIGYGVVKKRDVTGAIVSLKSNDIVLAPTSNVMEALQGKIAGMDIVKTSGQVGKDVDILLRGTRSIYGSNSPLFIIDGIPGSYSQLNPADIESVDVLKDASSTAIYGSAGANGVVIITTKKGKAGKPEVNFNAYYGFSGTPEYKHGMTGDEWTTYQREAYKYLNGQYPADMSSILTNPEHLALYNAGQWIDWVDEVVGNTATSQKYNLSVNAGNERSTLYASLTYEREEGLLKNELLNRYGLRLNADQELAKWAKIGFLSQLRYSDGDAAAKNTFTKGLSAFPLGTPYDNKGNIIYEYADGYYTPLGDWIPNEYVDNTRTVYANAQTYLELKPLDALSFRSVLGTTLSSSRRGQYWGDQCNANRPTYAGTPHASITNNDGYGYTWENILSFQKTIAKDHEVGATLVYSGGIMLLKEGIC
jgi:TonB-linked SusC/RagA family outer membrane protein